MPNYSAYQKSISDELICAKDRVRNFIDGHHWPEDGRYKETLLSNIIRRQLPQNISVGTGFVMCSNGDGTDTLTSQIDIIVYDNSVPLLFSIDNFIIVPQNAVVGIIEVKSKLTSSIFRTTVKKSHENGELISRNYAPASILFNAIFSYETEFNFERSASSIESTLKEYSGFVNHISFSKDYFLKLWKKGHPYPDTPSSHYSIYELNDLSFGYFISNLIAIANRRVNHNDLSFSTQRMFFSIPKGKEAYLLHDFNLDTQESH